MHALLIATLESQFQFSLSEGADRSRPVEAVASTKSCIEFTLLYTLAVSFWHIARDSWRLCVETTVHSNVKEYVYVSARSWTRARSRDIQSDATRWMALKG